MSSELGTQTTVAVLVSLLMQWAKQSTMVPWISTKTEILNRWVAAIVSLASGFGIYFAWDHSGTLIISGLTAAHLFHALVRALQQWVFQKVAYRVVIAPPLPGAVQHAEEMRNVP
jgi:hypothetical protein